MADGKKVAISKTLNGDIIYHIARNSSGQIVARELTLEALHKAIKIYQEPPPVKEEIPVEASSAEGSGEPKKKFLINKLAEKVQKRKREQKTAETALPEEEKEEEKPLQKESFWDRLK